MLCVWGKGREWQACGQRCGKIRHSPQMQMQMRLLLLAFGVLIVRCVVHTGHVLQIEAVDPVDTDEEEDMENDDYYKVRREGGF